MGAWYFESSAPYRRFAVRMSGDKTLRAAGGPTNGRLSKIESLTLGFSPKEKIFFANIEESGAMRHQIRSSF